MESTIKCCVAISGIVILEAIALMKGIDGVYLSAAVAAIAALGGYVVAKATK